MSTSRPDPPLALATPCALELPLRDELLCPPHGLMLCAVRHVTSWVHHGAPGIRVAATHLRAPPRFLAAPLVKHQVTCSGYTAHHLICLIQFLLPRDRAIR